MFTVNYKILVSWLFNNFCPSHASPMQVLKTEVENKRSGYISTTSILHWRHWCLISIGFGKLFKFFHSTWLKFSTCVNGYGGFDNMQIMLLSWNQQTEFSKALIQSQNSLHRKRYYIYWMTFQVMLDVNRKSYFLALSLRNDEHLSCID